MDQTKIANNFPGKILYYAGIVGFIAVIMLILLYALLPIDSMRSFTLFFGFLNDSLTLVMNSLLLLFMVLLINRQAHNISTVDKIGSFFGIAGAAGTVVVMALFIIGQISLIEQGVYYLLCLGPLGIWFLLLNQFGVLNKQYPKKIWSLGILIGVAMIICFISFFLFAGLEILTATEYSALYTNYPLIIGASFGVLAYLGVIFWAWRSGKILIR